MQQVARTTGFVVRGLCTSMAQGKPRTSKPEVGATPLLGIGVARAFDSYRNGRTCGR